MYMCMYMHSIRGVGCAYMYMYMYIAYFPGVGEIDIEHINLQDNVWMIPHTGQPTLTLEFVCAHSCTCIYIYLYSHWPIFGTLVIRWVQKLCIIIIIDWQHCCLYMKVTCPCTCTWPLFSLPLRFFHSSNTHLSLWSWPATKPLLLTPNSILAPTCPPSLCRVGRMECGYQDNRPHPQMNCQTHNRL